MSDRLPVVSGDALVRVLARQGWEVVRQRGSHVVLRHAASSNPLVVPLHRQLERGTLLGIRRDAGIYRDELRALP